MSVKRGRYTQQQVDSFRGLIKPSLDYNDLKDVRSGRLGLVQRGSRVWGGSDLFVVFLFFFKYVTGTRVCGFLSNGKISISLI